MTEQIEHAINQGELDEAKRLILESARRSRTVVGLPEESGLSPLHVAAFHDAEAAESMVKMGLDLPYIKSSELRHRSHNAT